MKRRVYLETTVVSYLTARPSRSLLSAAHQQVTIDWWETRHHDFEVVVSELVIREAEVGDPVAAKKRLEVLETLPQLLLTEEALELANAFVAQGIIPAKVAEDSLHIAVATVHEVDYLLTWNCTHIANPEIQARLATFLTRRQRFLPFICTPEELLGGEE
ncbi:MAG: type II toxin-antitoxin system VapC family toxin [Thermoanaerobaculia bacterium]|nr:type II toxin-antitoxin system VapC family toxin [Thermoanaerobaculia bacterium]